MKKLFGIVIACLLFVGCASTRSSDNCTNGKCSPGWIADKNTGCKVWNPKPVPNETITWSGQCVNGFAEGRGTEVWYKNGNLNQKRVTEMEGGKPVNYYNGTCTWANGDVYEGDFVDNNFNGKGKYTYASGDVYEGDYVDGKRTGKGKYTYASGDVYEGDFVDSNFHGYGTKWYANGDKYTGKWENDERLGKTENEKKKEKLSQFSKFAEKITWVRDRNVIRKNIVCVNRVEVVVPCDSAAAFNTKPKYLLEMYIKLENSNTFPITCSGEVQIERNDLNRSSDGHFKNVEIAPDSQKHLSYEMWAWDDKKIPIPEFVCLFGYEDMNVIVGKGLGKWRWGIGASKWTAVLLNGKCIHGSSFCNNIHRHVQ